MRVLRLLESVLGFLLGVLLVLLHLRRPAPAGGPSAGGLPEVTPVHEQLRRIWEALPGELGWVSTVDHKRIGERYLVTAFVFFVLAGGEALLMRTQLAVPENTLLGPDAYNALFTMHGVTMIFLFATPLLSGFGNYLIPLLVGARDMAFPRLNALGYWIFLFSGIFFYWSFLAEAVPNDGWFDYVPLANQPYSPTGGIDFYCIGLLFLGLSTTVGAVNFIVTILKLRAPGMSLDRMPLFAWNILVTAVAMLFAIPSLTVATALLELDRSIGMRWFDVSQGGDSLLWQHLFWIFGHPDVYIIFMPAVGIVSMVIPAFSRRPIVGYTLVVLASVATIILSFGVWVHHMFATGLPPLALTIFSAASMMIAIPAGVQVIAWITTILLGRPRVTTAFLFAVGFIVLFLIGGMTGVMIAAVPFDLQVTDSYFIVAHFHYVLFGGAVFPIFAGLYYWSPKITGRVLGEGLGRWNFWLMFVGFNLTFFPMHIAGILGMPRRIYTYPADPALDVLNLTETAGAYVLAAGILLFVANVWRTLRAPANAGADPWRANTLEWSVASPPPVYDFAVIPVVASRDPLWEPAPSVRPPEPRELRLERRETMTSSALDADPQLLAWVPADSAWPFVLAVGLALAFMGWLERLPLLLVFGVAVVFAAGVAWMWPHRRDEDIAVPGRSRAAWSEPGFWGMGLAIASDLTIFAILLVSYVYLGFSGGGPWPPSGMTVPELTLPLAGTALLLGSSIPIQWADAGIEKGDVHRLRLGLALGIVMAAGFVGIQGWEFLHKDFAPQANAYASAFYTITSFHGLHVVAAILLMSVLFWRATLGHFAAGRSLAVRNVALYWHFVGAVWVFILGIVYLSPHVLR